MADYQEPTGAEYIQAMMDTKNIRELMERKNAPIRDLIRNDETGKYSDGPLFSLFGRVQNYIQKLEEKIEIYECPHGYDRHYPCTDCEIEQRKLRV